LLGWVLVLAFSAGAVAQGLTVQASVDRNRVAVGETLSLTVSVSAEGLSSAAKPELPDPDGFQVTGRSSSSSTSISITNGRMTTTTTISYVYSLRARWEGSFTIGPARVEYDGKIHQSGKVRVEVGKASRRPQTRRSPAPGTSTGARDLRTIEENLFIQARPNKQEPYVGEQVDVAYTLYTRYDIQNASYGHVPTYTGFWTETLHDAKRLDYRAENVDGRTFRATTLKRVALFPTSAGDQVLEQLEVVCDIPRPRQRRGLFDFDSFFSDPFRSQKVTVRSGALALKVRALPGGAPRGFSGAVGRYLVKMEASPPTLVQGDPVTLRVVVSGTGCLNAVPEPIRPEAPGIRYYDPKASIERIDSGGKVGGRKTFEYVLIPEEAGIPEIPPFRLVFFDPDRERYYTAASRPIPLSVSPAQQVSRASAVPRLSREEVRSLGEDIRYIKPDVASLADQGTPIYRGGWFLGLQLLPLLALFGTFLFTRHRERLLGDVAYARRRRSRSEANRRLAEARRLLKAGEGALFHAEAARALAQFLADRLNLSAAGMTGESATAALVDKGVSEALTQQVGSVFQQCDLARFAPAQISGEASANLYEAVDGLIRKLGRAI